MRNEEDVTLVPPVLL